MRRGSLRAVAVDARPRGSGEARSIAPKSIAGEADAPIRIRERGVLPVARDEDDVRIQRIRRESAMLESLKAREDFRGRYAKRGPACPKIVGPENP